MISPVLFCIYIDKLLFNLDANGGGCFIGKMCVGELAHANYIVLIAPRSRAMRRMLSTCDSFADNFSIVFNAKKMSLLLTLVVLLIQSLFFTLEVMQLRLLTSDLTLAILLTTVLMMLLIFHLGVIQW